VRLIIATISFFVAIIAFFSLPSLFKNNIPGAVIMFILGLLFIAGGIVLIKGYFRDRKAKIKYCEECGKQLPSRYKKKYCEECNNKRQEKINEIKNIIINSQSIDDETTRFIKNLDKEETITLYEEIFKKFEEDNELDEKEIELLNNIQEIASLTNEEIKYKERLLPYLYVHSIKTENKLPTPKLKLEGVGNIIYKKNETPHYAAPAILQELKTISLGYRGGSHGVSIRIAKGVRYRVGGHRGHIEKETKYVETSRGVLLVTNQRIFLHPFPGNKPLSIPLKKILSYNCYENGIELYKEGREKGYFLKMDSGDVELFGICLSHLLSEGV